MFTKGLQVTHKQELILNILFEFRGMLYKQLMPVLTVRWGRKGGNSFEKNTYKDLQKLEEMKLINREKLRIKRIKELYRQTVAADFIYLTEAGLEYVSEQLEIPRGHVGTGWNEDWGDFVYDLHRPPKVKSAVIYHHLMLTDTLLRLESFKHHNPTLLDYRDNRYSSVKFQIKGEVHRFRPDAEIRFNSKRYYIEVDRGTEYGEKLREKFISYRQYFQYLKEKGEPLPDGVIFVTNNSTENGASRRWSLISSAFMNEMQEWASIINLSTSSISNLSSLLRKELHERSDYEDFYKKMTRYRTDISSFMTLAEQGGIPWKDAPLSIVNVSDNENRLYVYIRYEPFETIGIARIYTWWKWYLAARTRYSNLSNVKHFVPVLWSPLTDPTPINLKGFEIEKEISQVLANQIWLRSNRHPKWFNSVGEEVKTGHPLQKFPL